MTRLSFTRSASGTEAAPLVRPQPLTAQTSLGYEHMIAGALAMVGFGLLDRGVGHVCAHPVGAPDAADIEYASLMSDPGAIEVDSWAARMRACVQ
jgi:hypothetical protein